MFDLQAALEDALHDFLISLHLSDWKGRPAGEQEIRIVISALS